MARAQRAVTSSYPNPGWVEQSPADLWNTQLAVAREAVASVGVDAIRAVAIANQRETSLLWHRHTLEPIGPAIVWQCRRTSDAAARLASDHRDAIRKKSGLTPDAYFSGPKLAWLLGNVPGASDLADAGDLAAGTVDSWLLAKLTSGRVHATDTTNASRTMLWNLSDRCWDDELCRWQGVPPSILPEVRSSASEFGETAPDLLGRPLPILAVAGDQQASLYGHEIVEPGSAKCTYGTGAFVLAHAGRTAIPPPRGLLTTAAADGGFAFEGGVFTAGSVVQWLRDALQLADSAPGVSALAASSEDSGGVTFVPAFAGLGSPHWDPHARAAVLGLSRGSSSGQIARAALESISFRVREIVQAMETASGSIDELRVDGGMTASEVMMQIQANALQRPILRPTIQETTSLGVARLAMLAAGVEAQIERSDDRFVPDGDLEAPFSAWTSARRAVQTLARETARDTGRTQ